MSNPLTLSLVRFLIMCLGGLLVKLRIQMHFNSHLIKTWQSDTHRLAAQSQPVSVWTLIQESSSLPTPTENLANIIIPANDSIACLGKRNIDREPIYLGMRKKEPSCTWSIVNHFNTIQADKLRDIWTVILMIWFSIQQRSAPLLFYPQI